MSQYFDSHAHVNFSAFKGDGEDILKQCLEEGVFVVNVGSQYSTSKRAVEYANKFKTGVWAAVGTHPVHLNKGSFSYRDPEEEISEVEIKTNGEEFEREKYLELANDAKVVAIGEVGLDYHHFEEGIDTDPLKEKQKEILKKFIDLANEVQKPLIIHCWDAYDDLLEILQNNVADKKGIVHSFVGSYKTANKFIELGYKIGLNGIITYGESYDRLIKEIGLENIVIETDCPYLTPRPLEKSKRNEPVFVKFVAQKIADVKGISIEEVAEKTTQNGKEVFGIK
ncbi:MAG TPA: TatD family hydrolase [Candidatus Moranbacteria bacterium]|jgi:TatD DNase family protein|nr:TatD family hydrolase [Candidatus Moranbacteria bacterium]HPX94281.1 TatD family hydrolase [Candidatus Moranbacteria bacterium]HQB59732.1 TatD family hydrolase [Candidatus Moranbacteria bacterium]